MAIEVELPDGTIAEFPDGMADDQINAVLQRQFGPPTAGAAPAAPVLGTPDGRLTDAGWQAERDSLAASRQKEIDGTSFWDNLVAGYGRSLPNLAQGVQQLGADAVAATSGAAADVLGDFGGQTLGDLRRDGAAYFRDLSGDLQRETAQERRDSAALTDSGGGKLGGFLGDVANTWPAMGLGVAAKGAGAAKAIGQAALGGAIQGGIQPVAQDGERLKNTGLNAALGGGLSAAGRGAMTLGENVLPNNVVARGINYFNERANSKPFAAEGEALAQRTGIDLTPGMVSGSRAQVAVENMSRQSVFSADRAFEADEKLATQAIDNVNRLMDRITPNSASAQTIGNRVQETVDRAVTSVADRRDEMAKQQFGAIRRMVGDAPVVDYAATRKVLEDMIAENADVLGSDPRRVRTQAQRMLDELSGKKGFSLESARKSRSSYGKAARGQANLLNNVDRNVNQTFAKRMYAAISDDIEAAGSRLDEAAGFGQNGVAPAGTTVTRPSELLKQANDEYRNHSDLLRLLQQSPMKRLLGDKIDVDGFTSFSLPPETVVARMNSMVPSELAQVRHFMERQEPEVWQQYKRMLVDDALAEASSVPATGGAKVIPFNAGGFIRALGGDKPDKVEKLDAIFGPTERAEIMDALQAARRMADGFGKNHSGTGPYMEVMQASRGFVDAFKNASVQAAAGTAAPIAGLNNIARMMVDSKGRRALIELSRLPPSSRKANDIAAYLATVVNPGSDEPLEIDIVGGRTQAEANAGQ